ncbi:MAG: acyltransferase [Thermodesulfobacteriota bacterium]
MTNDNSKSELLFKRHYPALDLLRAVAITLVMFRHFADRGFTGGSDAYILDSKFLMWGSNGVILFFVLSGFLIGGQIMEELSNSSFSFKKFFFKRLLRIFPPYYFAIIINVILILTGLVATELTSSDGFAHYFNNFIVNIFSHILYLQIYIAPEYFATVYWSLSVEEHFYILSPTLLYLGHRYAKRYLGTGLFLLLLLIVAMRMADYYWRVDLAFWFDKEVGRLLKIPLEPNLRTPQKILMIPLFLVNLFDGILLGVLAAYLFIRYNEWLKSVSNIIKIAILFLSLDILAFCVIYRVPSGRIVYLDIAWGSLIPSFGFSLLILTCITLPLEKIIRPKKLFSSVAKLSYTMYLYHLFLILPFLALFKETFFTNSFTSFYTLFAAYFIVTTVISAGIYSLVDRPCMKYRAKVISRWRD